MYIATRHGNQNSRSLYMKCCPSVFPIDRVLLDANGDPVFVLLNTIEFLDITLPLITLSSPIMLRSMLDAATDVLFLLSCPQTTYAKTG